MKNKTKIIIGITLLLLLCSFFNTNIVPKNNDLQQSKRIINIDYNESQITPTIINIDNKTISNKLNPAELVENHETRTLVKIILDKW